MPDTWDYVTKFLQMQMLRILCKHGLDGCIWISKKNFEECWCILFKERLLTFSNEYTKKWKIVMVLIE